MNRRVTHSFVSVLLVTSIVGVAPFRVSAQAAVTDTGISAKPSDDGTAQTLSTNAADAGATTKSSEVLQQRIKNRTERLNTKLSNAESARLKVRCSAAQTKIQVLSGRASDIEANRKEIYGAVLARLSQLKTRLSTQGVDVSQMQTHIDRYKELVSKFEADLATYKAAVADAGEIDCVSDPTAFKSALEESRSARVTLAEDAQNIRTYVSTDVHAYLEELKKTVSARQGE